MDVVSTRVFATPEAFELLMTSTDSEEIRTIIRDVINASKGGSTSVHNGYTVHFDPSPYTCFDDWPFSLHIRQEDTEKGVSLTVLLYRKDGQPKHYYGSAPNFTAQSCGDTDVFNEALETAIEISIA